MEPHRIFDIANAHDFSQHALGVFRHQFRFNESYREYCLLLGRNDDNVKELSEVPYLPIEFFKKRKVTSGSQQGKFHFTSSGTTGSIQSRHYVADIALYERSYLSAFELFYGPVSNYTILALLPSYLERKGSSLVYMVGNLIKKSGRQKSGFYLDDLENLRSTLLKLRDNNERIMLIGVSFALLEFADRYPLSIPEAIVMETGGMKGRKKEMVREELHHRLKQGFGVSAVHSEYGMTELLSQAYSSGEGIFRCPPWMRIYIREAEDPLSGPLKNQTGGVNIIDLANFHSCAFIATQDLGKQHGDGRFEILGRFDHSDVRGCNLMAL
jgi:hypothetical protein